MNRIIILVAAATSLVASTASAQTAPHSGGPPTASVRYGDLDLHTAAGVDTLQARIRAAAQRVCQDPPSIADLTAYAQYRQCVVDAALTARPQAEAVISQAQAIVVAGDGRGRR